MKPPLITEIFPRHFMGFLCWSRRNKQGMQRPESFLDPKEEGKFISIPPELLDFAKQGGDAALLNGLPEKHYMATKNYYNTIVLSNDAALSLAAISQIFDDDGEYVYSEPCWRRFMAMGSARNPIRMSDLKLSKGFHIIRFPKKNIEILEQTFGVDIPFRFGGVCQIFESCYLTFFWGPEQNGKVYQYLIQGEIDEDITVDEAVNAVPPSSIELKTKEDIGRYDVLRQLGRVVVNHAFLMKITGTEEIPGKMQMTKNKLIRDSKKKKHPFKASDAVAALHAMPIHREPKGYKTARWLAKNNTMTATQTEDFLRVFNEENKNLSSHNSA